ncbi:opsin-2-like [Pollicipes pollicipes]|uniref:opsin-2-like n=1 Tax=Pollicipes pollicipes TaxID=41117 RepID=UPI001885606D|nr:opsin-2-like [Pollicipes pollicipes]
MSSGVVRACDESAGSCPSVVNVTSRDVNVTSLLLENGYDVRSWLQLGLCSRPYLQSIQPFWARFPAPPYWYHLAIAACYALILLVGCAGNLFVICVFARHRKLRKPSNLLLLNLAISDLVMVFKSVTIVTNSVFAGPVLGVIGCEFYGFSTGVTGITSIMTLASIAKDRCRAICKPLDLTHQLTRRQAYANILGVWAYGLLFSVLPLMGVEGIRFTPEGYLTSCSFDYTSDSAANKAFILVFFTAAWILPCCEICRCYYKWVDRVEDADGGPEVAEYSGLSDSDMQAEYSGLSDSDMQAEYSALSDSELQAEYSALSDSELQAEYPALNDSEFQAEIFRTVQGTTFERSMEERKDSTWRCSNNRKCKSEIRLARVIGSVVLLWFLSWSPYAAVALMGVFGQQRYITPLITMIPEPHRRCQDARWQVLPIFHGHRGRAAIVDGDANGADASPDVPAAGGGRRRPW